MMAFSGRLAVLLVLGCFITNIPAKVHYKIQKMECIPNLRYLQNHTCQVKPINRFLSEIHMHCHLVETLRDVTLRLRGFQKNDRNRWNPFLINIAARVCPLLARQSFTIYLNTVLQLLEKYSNVNHSCPYKPGPLFVRNLTFDTSILPNALPTGHYKMSLLFTESVEHIFVGEALIYFQAMDADERKSSHPKIRLT